MVFWKKNKRSEVVIEDRSRFDGKIYKGLWLIGDKKVVGAYQRDGSNTFITENGVYHIPAGTKKTQLRILNDEEIFALGVNADYINEFIEDVKNGYCTILIPNL